jgi:hypothetical protein
MPKDYQEIERIVEEFQNKDHIITSDGGLYVAVDAHWLSTTLKEYGNARVEEIIKMAEELRLDAELHYDMRGMEQTKYYAQALTDLIKAIKK